MVDIYLPDNGHFGKLSITGGIVVTFFNKYDHPIYISFNEVKVPSKTLFVDDSIHITNYNNDYDNKYKYKRNKKKYLLRDINIKGISEETMNNKINRTVSQSNNNYTTVSTSSISNKQIEELKKQLAEYKSKAEKAQKDLENIKEELEKAKESTPIEKPEEEPQNEILLVCTATAKYDEFSKSIFEYNLSCGQCSQVIPLICQQCKTSLSNLLNHTGAINPDDENESNRYYFRKEDEVLQKVLDSGNIKCPNCKYNFKQDQITMNLESKIIVITEDIVDKDEAKFVIQNTYSCSSCGTVLENGVIKSEDTIDITYQPLKNVEQNITNFIDILTNPGNHTIPEFLELYTKIYLLQLPLLSDDTHGTLNKLGNNEKCEYISNIVVDSKSIYDKYLNTYNNVENRYNMCLDVFAKYIDKELKDKAIEILDTFKQNTILSCIESCITWCQETTNGSKAREILVDEISNEDFNIIMSEDNRNFFEQYQTIIMTMLMNNYKINLDGDNKLIIEPDSNIIYKFQSISENSTDTFSFNIISKNSIITEREYDIQAPLSKQIEQLLTAQNKFQKDCTGFLDSIIEKKTECTKCHAKFILK